MIPSEVVDHSTRSVMFARDRRIAQSTLSNFFGVKRVSYSYQGVNKGCNREEEEEEEEEKEIKKKQNEAEAEAIKPNSISRPVQRRDSVSPSVRFLRLFPLRGRDGVSGVGTGSFPHRRRRRRTGGQQSPGRDEEAEPKSLRNRQGCFKSFETG